MSARRVASIPGFHPLSRVAFNGFFFARCLRASGRFVECVRVTSSQHPRISSANLFMGDAREAEWYTLYTEDKSYTTSCIAARHVPTNLFMSGFRALPLLFACLLMYLAWCIIRRLRSITVNDVSWREMQMQAYIRVVRVEIYIR